MLFFLSFDIFISADSRVIMILVTTMNWDVYVVLFLFPATLGFGVL